MHSPGHAARRRHLATVRCYLRPHFGKGLSMMRRLHIAALGFAASILSALGDQVLPMVTNSADVSFSTDGKTLAVLGRDNQVRFWDLATAHVTRTLGPEASDAFCFLLPSGNQLLTISTNRVLRIRDTVSGGILSS